MGVWKEKYNLRLPTNISKLQTHIFTKDREKLYNNKSITNQKNTDLVNVCGLNNSVTESWIKNDTAKIAKSTTMDRD